MVDDGKHPCVGSDAEKQDNGCPEGGITWKRRGEGEEELTGPFQPLKTGLENL